MFLFVCFDWAREVQVMSVPVVGFSFKPMALALVTSFFHQEWVWGGKFVMGRGGNKLKSNQVKNTR